MEHHNLGSQTITSTIKPCLLEPTPLPDWGLWVFEGLELRGVGPRDWVCGPGGFGLKFCFGLLGVKSQGLGFLKDSLRGLHDVGFCGIAAGGSVLGRRIRAETFLLLREMTTFAQVGEVLSSLNFQQDSRSTIFQSLSTITRAERHAELERLFIQDLTDVSDLEFGPLGWNTTLTSTSSTTRSVHCCSDFASASWFAHLGSRWLLL